MNQLVDVVTTAGLMYVVTLGLFVVMSIMGVVNMAHGAFLTIGGYAAVFAMSNGVSYWLALPVAVVAGAILGLFVERVLMIRLYERPLDTILATWGLGLVLTGVIMVLYGRNGQLVPVPVQGGPYSLWGIDIARYRLIIAVVAVAFIIGIYMIARYTLTGVLARAVIMNPALARGLGVNVRLVNLITFVTGSAIAVLCGALIAPLVSVDPNMGFPWLITAFMIVLVAGASLGGLAVASLLIAAAVNLSNYFIGPVYGNVALVLVPVLLLRFWPGGLADVRSLSLNRIFGLRAGAR